jgi:hypothetical protein
VLVQVLVAVAVGAVAVAAALVLRRRQRPDAPTQPRAFVAPTQLDRRDFTRPDAPWLVAVFSSATCDTCAAMVAKARVLESAEVAVQEVEVRAEPAVHRRYAIQAVPLLVVADAAGVVRTSFIGPTSATDVWAALAEARAPGSTPRPL